MSHSFVFVTGNMYKVKMLEGFLGPVFEHHALDLPEIQSLDKEKVLEIKARDAYEIIKKPVLVDDISVNIHAMGGLPGTFIKFFIEALGLEGICKMVNAFEDRTATATTIFGFYDGKQFRAFKGEVEGAISAQPLGTQPGLASMGWNSIFIPKGQTKTLAEMGEGVFEAFTPRAIAVEKLKKFLETEV